MKRTSLLIIISVLLHGCEQRMEKPIPFEEGPKTSSELVEKSEKLFISLDSKMTDKEFANAIDSLIEKKKLINGKFVLDLLPKEIPLSISKTKIAVVLSYEEIKESPIVSAHPPDHYFFINSYHRIVESVVELYDSQYSSFAFPLPEKQVINLSGSDKKQHKLYLTPTKVVLLEYAVIGAHVEIPSKRGQKQIGCQIKIYYIHRQDFATILNSLEEQLKIEAEASEARRENENHYQRLKEKNLEDI